MVLVGGFAMERRVAGVFFRAYVGKRDLEKREGRLSLKPNFEGGGSFVTLEGIINFDEGGGKGRAWALG